MTPKLPACWILVADQSRARLLHGTKTEHGRNHFDETDSIASKPMDREHGRPSRLGQTTAAFSHEEEEHLRRFAHEVVAWIDRQMKTRQIDHVQLFAPARFLGEFRKLVSPALRAKVSEQDVELMHLTAGDLAQHPEVRKCMEA